MTEGNEHDTGFAKKILRGVTRAAKGMALSQMARLRVASDRRTEQELRQLDWSRMVIDEGARLTKASIEYLVQLGAAWRTLTLDAWCSALGGEVQGCEASKG
jgi:hypothetical protein